MNSNVSGDLFGFCVASAMEATGYKVFNDSVHGHITLHPLLVKVVDTPEFQRLRNVKQLGVGYYVFPGASNCRYEHSLGTCYLAGQMMDKLMSRESQKSRSPLEVAKLSLCVQMAALCHDLGHGPFSHTWETVTKLWGHEWTHEEASCDMFDYLVEKNNLVNEFETYGLKKPERKLIKELIMGGSQEKQLKPKDNFIYEIVSNKHTGIDVDKWDYFLRDGLHLNLRITFDYRRLMEFCTVIEGEAPECYTHIAFRDKEIMNLYDVYRVRSALHHTAYKHKVVYNIELMIIDAFKLAGDAEYKINNSSIHLKEAHTKPEWLSELTDHVFYDLLYSRDPDVNVQRARALLNRVLQRRLYKFVGQAHLQLPRKGRQEYLQESRKRLIDGLNNISSEFRVADYFLDLDSENDPVSRVVFYQKVKETNGQSSKIKEVKFEEIRNLLEPFPFQLTKETTAKFMVFCTSEEITEEDLEKAKKVVHDFSERITS